MPRIMTQVSAHVENRPGALAELTAALHEAGVNILGVSVPDTGEFGTVRLLPDDALEAREALRDAGIPHTAVDVLVVDLPHQPGSLAKLTAILAEANVNIRYAYATNATGAAEGMCVLQVDDIHKAEQVLGQKLQ